MLYLYRAAAAEAEAEAKQYGIFCEEITFDRCEAETFTLLSKTEIRPFLPTVRKKIACRPRLAFSMAAD